MERPRQSLADAARDDTKKKENATKVLRAPMVGKRESGMRVGNGIGSILNDASASEGGPWWVGGLLCLTDQSSAVDTGCTRR